MSLNRSTNEEYKTSSSSSSSAAGNKSEETLSTIHMTNKEKDRKELIIRIVANLQKEKHPCNKDIFELDFHRRMQNPINNTVELDSEGDLNNRGYLNNGLIGSLCDYFCENGRHLFGKSVTTLAIKNACLSGYFRGWDQMPDGTYYIAELIQKTRI